MSNSVYSLCISSASLIHEFTRIFHKLNLSLLSTAKPTYQDPAIGEYVGKFSKIFILSWRGWGILLKVFDISHIEHLREYWIAHFKTFHAWFFFFFFIFSFLLLGSPTVNPPEPKYVMRYYKTIPIGVVFVLSLVLWRRWKISQWVGEPVFLISIKFCFPTVKGFYVTG